MRVLLVRHGESTNNQLANQRSYDEYIRNRSHEPELTPAGRQQAEQLAAYMGALQATAQDETGRGASVTERPVTAIYTSPMLRAMQTAAPLAGTLGMSPEVWVEIHEHGGLFTGDPRNGEVVSYPGLSRAQIAARFRAFSLPPQVTESGWWSGGYEEMSACTVRAQRVAQTLRHWAPARPDDVLLLVTHGTFMDQLIKALLGVNGDSAFYFNHINTAISRIDFLDNGFVAIRYLNRAPHLTPVQFTR
ncbi:MAG: histidine phosphatase family protein [Caldilineaceae bacterium]|nr:histidine phosphatase family protein [Caldilineaceae bacterium]